MAVVFLLSAVALAVIACGEEDQPTEPEEPASTVTSVDIAPDSAALAALGATRKFEATARDQDGSVMSDVDFSWSVEPDSVAAMGEDGTATAESNGAAAVVAEASGVADTAALVVDQEAVSLSVSPDSARLDSVGDTVQFDAAAEDANGHSVENPDLAWSSSDTAVAMVDSVGLATARSEGSAAVTAEASRASDSAALEVRELGEYLVQKFDVPERSAGRSGTKTSLAASVSRLVYADDDPGVVIFGRDGSVLAQTDLGSFFSSELTNPRPVEPRVLFDRESGRFFLSTMDFPDWEHDCGGGTIECDGGYLLAVSKDEDPSALDASDWHMYRLPTPSLDDDVHAIFPDFHRSGVTQNALVLIGMMAPVNPDRMAEVPGFEMIRILDKEEVVDGQVSDWTDLDTLREDGERSGRRHVPAKRSRSSSNTHFIWQKDEDCSLYVFSLRDPLGSPSFQRARVAGSELGGRYDCRNRPNAPQPETDWRLDTGDRSSSPNARPVLHGDVLWTATQVGVTREDGKTVTGIRWVKIRVPGWPGSPEVLESDVFATEHFAFQPAVAATSDGDLVVVYGRSSDTEPPSTYYRFSRASWPSDSTSEPHLLAAGEASFTGGETLQDAIRLGYVYPTSLDPEDGNIWITGRFAPETDRYQDLIGKVAF